MKFINNFFKLFVPRYHFSLDSDQYDLNRKQIVYRFKVYGMHEFEKFTYQEIIEQPQLINDINPLDLIKIARKEVEESKNKELLKISETLRGNYYTLSNDKVSEIISGEEVCENPSLLQMIKNTDLYKIAYNTGFLHGRQFSKNLNQSTCQEDKKPAPKFNVIDGGIN